MPTRRSLLVSAAALFTAAMLALPRDAQARARRRAQAIRLARQRLTGVEARTGGRLGVAILDTADGAELGYRSDERFPMCSTAKVLAVAALLSRIDRGNDRLDRWVPYDAADLLSYAPVTREHATKGGMRIEDLCAAAIEWSDNTAANLLLQSVGGPAAVTRYARTLGDRTSRLDRTEPSLNTAVPGDDRDTTSPAAMVHDLRRLLLGDALSVPSRHRLEGWMTAAKTGAKRLRAGLPADWQVGDKTGTGDNGTGNVVAILRPPGRPPLLAAVYMTEVPDAAQRLDPAHAEVGRIIAEMV